MNLYEKLIEIRKAVPYLQQAARGTRYTYVKSSQTLAPLRSKMDELGVLLVPKITGIETSTRGKQLLTELHLSYTFINAEKPDERLEQPWYGQGLDYAEKGVGKACTYAEKYFLLKFFQIPTDADDPDRFQQEHGQLASVSPKVATREGKSPRGATGKQRQRIDELARAQDATERMRKLLRQALYEHNLSASRATWLIDSAERKLAELKDQREALAEAS
jgi:hypothetical protein